MIRYYPSLSLWSADHYIIYIVRRLVRVLVSAGDVINANQRGMPIRKAALSQSGSVFYIACHCEEFLHGMLPLTRC